MCFGGVGGGYEREVFWLQEGEKEVPLRLVGSGVCVGEGMTGGEWDE